MPPIGAEHHDPDIPLHVESLTYRERQMAHAVSRGLRNRQIAREFGISEETVKKHLATIYGKLALCGRVALAVHVLRSGLENDMRAHSRIALRRCTVRQRPRSLRFEIARLPRDGGPAYIVPGLIAATTRLANSPALPWCQRHTMTRSWSGDTVMVLLPAPFAENALVGSPASALPVVLSHHR